MTTPLDDLARRVEPPWCEKCHAHIVPMKRLELAWSWVCWWLVMHWPLRFFMRLGMPAILPWAGNIAYRCTCRANNRAAALRALSRGRGQ